MSDQQLLEFPCAFPIKAFGRVEGLGETGPESFVDLLLEIIGPHVNNLQRDQLSINQSSKGRFVAVTIHITAHSQEQLDRIYQTLSDHEKVVMSL